MKVPTSIYVESRAWFDKSGGNSYFSNRVWVDGKIAYSTGLEYGYEDSFLDSAIDSLSKYGYFMELEDMIEYRTPAWKIAERTGIHIYESKTWGRKRDLWDNNPPSSWLAEQEKKGNE